MRRGADTGVQQWEGSKKRQMGPKERSILQQWRQRSREMGTVEVLPMGKKRGWKGPVGATCSPSKDEEGLSVGKCGTLSSSGTEEEETREPLEGGNAISRPEVGGSGLCAAHAKDFAGRAPLARIQPIIDLISRVRPSCHRGVSFDRATSDGD